GVTRLDSILQSRGASSGPRMTHSRLTAEACVRWTMTRASSPLACRRTRLRPWMPPFAGIPRTQLDTMKAGKFRWRLAPLWLLSTLTELSLVRCFIQCNPSLDRLRVTLRAMQDGRKVVGRLANGETVWSGLDNDHLIAHPDVIPHLHEAL